MIGYKKKRMLLYLPISYNQLSHVIPGEQCFPFNEQTLGYSTRLGYFWTLTFLHANQDQGKSHFSSTPYFANMLNLSILLSYL